jgi:LPS export ABC transporter protein LptC
MRTASLERSILFSVAALLIGLGLWMQLGLLTERSTTDTTEIRHQPDYFIEKFLARGRDGSGTKYILKGGYLEHFPNNSTIDIAWPCLLLFEEGSSPQLVFADRGRVIENSTMIVLRGNVEVLEHLPNNINESLFLPRHYSSPSCFSTDISDGTWTRTNEIVLQLKPSPEH